MAAVVFGMYFVDHIYYAQHRMKRILLWKPNYLLETKTAVSTSSKEPIAISWDAMK